MGYGNWFTVKQIFQAALERDPADRAAFLAEACQGDSGLRDEVESLLANDASSLTWIDGSVFDAAPVWLSDGSEPSAADGTLPPGGRIGPWEIIREIGRGGMGTVFLAVRSDDQYRKEVAVKLVNRGMANRDVLRRFRKERQILASFEHPHIARLYDGGVTHDSLPYFIMEKVSGTPIDRYCDEHRLCVAARVELFVAVCAAVEYAHRRLVVHCDLKPSNILVTADGLPKLLDFGIAKLLDPDAADGPATGTLPWARRLTPEYASPEQVRGEPITTSSDIYSLAVLLYQLLVGRRPYRFANRDRREIEQLITETEPLRPSVAVLEEDVEPPRGAGPRRSLRRRLAGDLDTIVLTALRKDPLERYGSVEQLAEDLARQSQGLPIRARPPSWTYGMSRFVRRHRVGVAATVLIVLSLLGGLAATLRMAWVANEERHRVTRVASFMERLFELADPFTVDGRDLSVGSLLDQWAHQVERELTDQPDAQAQMMKTLGEAYRHLGLYDRATVLLEGSLDLRQSFAGAASPEVADSLHALCSLRQDQMDHATAELLCRQAVELRRQTLGDDAPQVADSLRSLGQVLMDRGNLADAEGYFRQALNLNLRLRGEDHLEVAITRHHLGQLLRRREMLSEADLHLARAAEIYGQRLGEDHPWVSTVWNSRAGLLKDQGRFEEAERLYRQALELRRRVLGEHVFVVRILNNLATLLFYSLGDAAAAEPLYREALDLAQRLVDEDHDLRATLLNHLGQVRHALGDDAEAGRLLRRALALRRRHRDSEDPVLAASLIGLGRFLSETGQTDEAESLLREAVDLLSARLGDQHPWAANARSLLGACLAAQGRFVEAEPLLEQSHDTLDARRGAEHPLTREARARLAAFYDARSRPQEAEP